MPKSIHRPEYAVLTRMLRDARVESGFHQTEVAEQLGRSQSFLSDVEQGGRRLDILELRDLCSILKIDFLSFVSRFDEAAKSTASTSARPRVKQSRSKQNRRNQTERG
ncbi:helix-turn-helix domain-containing protein [Arenimonas metalli]|uniref:helix-turn-helix domain-containing protein n=1 Tax=Arenimonas metalli TaxID=948077 RepID=UPI0009FED340